MQASCSKNAIEHSLVIVVLSGAPCIQAVADQTEHHFHTLQARARSEVEPGEDSKVADVRQAAQLHQTAGRTPPLAKQDEVQDVQADMGCTQARQDLPSTRFLPAPLSG